ncbi:MAG: hypothetical protein QOJ32_3047, partial [Frankiaceae bacterium]|nr:hypothetical protein [Frankiaceae bacterium]
MRAEAEPRVARCAHRRGVLLDAKRGIRRTATGRVVD